MIPISDKRAFTGQHLHLIRCDRLSPRCLINRSVGFTTNHNTFQTHFVVNLSTTSADQQSIRYNIIYADIVGKSESIKQPSTYITHWVVGR